MKRMVWFTADLHFGHESVISMQNRPFENASQMNDALIHNMNEMVGNDDILYVLGDVSHHISPEETASLVKRIHGHKVLLLGNHDVTGNPEVSRYDPSLFEWSGYYLKINTYGMNIIMMHYPLMTWAKRSAGSIMLHGHIHSTPAYNQKNIEEGIRRYDVGVDANDYYPVSILQIQKWAEKTGIRMSDRRQYD